MHGLPQCSCSIQLLYQFLASLTPVSVMQEIMNVEQIMDDNVGLELTDDNVETVLDEIRPYLVGMPQMRSGAVQNG